MTNICVDGQNRPMTNDEKTALDEAREQFVVETQAQAEAAEAKAAARQAVLDKLGLTADEAAALFG